MSDNDPEHPSRRDEAGKRTDWAEDRTILANERTFAAWIRTGLTSIAVAIGLQAVFYEFQPTWLAKSAATVFIVAAVLIFAAGAHRSVQAQKRIDSHIAATQPSWRMVMLAAILILGATGTAAILWLI